MSCLTLLEASAVGGLGVEAAKAASLQRQVDEFCAHVRENPAPEAPAYPIPWLRRRKMDFVERFRAPDATTSTDRQSLGVAMADESKFINWWAEVATHLQAWQGARVVSFMRW
jgi:hypothetical protein